MKPSTIYAVESFVRDLVSEEAIGQLQIERALKSNGLRLVPEASACDEKEHEAAVTKSAQNAITMLVEEARSEAEKMRPIGETDVLQAISIEQLEQVAESLFDE